MPSLTSFVLIGLSLAGAVHAEVCSTDALLSLASNTNLAGCTADTGLSVSSISTLTHDQIMAVCESSSCMALMDDVASLGLGDCTIPGSNTSVQTDILDSVASMCGGSGMASMGSMVSSSSESDTNVGNESGDSSSSTNVGDESGDSSTSTDAIAGSSGSSSTSGAATVTLGCVSAVATVMIAMLL